VHLLACYHVPFLLLVKYVGCQLEDFTSFLAFSAESNAFLIPSSHLLHQELVSKQISIRKLIQQILILAKQTKPNSLMY
jgi:hypothetical protein